MANLCNGYDGNEIIKGYLRRKSYSVFDAGYGFFIVLFLKIVSIASVVVRRLQNFKIKKFKILEENHGR